MLPIIIALQSCQKENQFLDAKPNQALTTPNSLADIQNLLDNESVFNSGNDPALGEVSCDDYVVQPTAYATLSTNLERQAYIWAKTLYDASKPQIGDWNLPYQMVYYSNVALESLAKVPNTNQTAFNKIKGTALFYRSNAFYNLVQEFSMPYDAGTASSQLGIPLRLTSDLNSKPQRSNEADCYNQIINDLKTAVTLLPITPMYKTQPSRPACNALLARVYLGIGDYPNALQYANECLSDFNVLVDYNTLNTPTSTGINNTYLPEDIFHTTLDDPSIIGTRRNYYIDSPLFNTYAKNDLRRTKFFATLDNLPQYPRFVGSYDFIAGKYDGLATDEIYLIKAECQARAGNVSDAMGTLNTLLKTRWLTGTFQPYTASSQSDAMYQILLERRKELLLRGTRWTDLRRLNKDPNYAITLSRTINGVTYTLPPNDPRYALPIPDIEVQLGGLTQNQR